MVEFLHHITISFLVESSFNVQFISFSSGISHLQQILHSVILTIFLINEIR